METCQGTETATNRQSCCGMCPSRGMELRLGIPQRFFVPPQKAATHSLVDQIPRWLEYKRSRNARPSTLSGYKSYLRKFTDGCGVTTVEAVTREVVEKWFAGRTENPGMMRGSIGKLSSFFQWCIKQDFIQSSPLARVERPLHDHQPVFVLSVEQCATLLQWTRQERPRALAYLVLALFHGVRPAELARVSWADIDGATLRIDGHASKTRRRRIIDLHPTALEWLRVAQDCPLPCVQGDRQAFTLAAAPALGFPSWPVDCLRHTAVSMWVAHLGEVARVAHAMGHSESILRQHYLALVRKSEADRFFALLP
jgi:integrase